MAKYKYITKRTKFFFRNKNLESTVDIKSNHKQKHIKHTIELENNVVTFGNTNSVKYIINTNAAKISFKFIFCFMNYPQTQKYTTHPTYLL